MTLEPGEVGELTAEAVEAQAAGHEDRVLDVLETVLTRGTSRDALAFVLGCAFAITGGLTPGAAIAMGPIRVYADGTVGVVANQLTRPGRQLFAEVLHDYLCGRPDLITPRWAAASDEDIAGAVGTAIYATGALLRKTRSVLN